MRRACILLVAVVACSPPGPAGKAERFRIPTGATFGQVMDTLDAHGLIGSRLIFKVRARAAGLDRAVRAGVYETERGVGASALLTMLAEGRGAQVRFTVPEGLTAADLADLASEQLRIPRDSMVAATHDSALADSLGAANGSLEGYLRPDTYLVPLGVSAREVVELMLQEYREMWTPEWRARLDTLQLTEREMLTLASIVEGEARVDDERAIIAGVYHNRLRIGMALQADPTVQYAIELSTGERKKRLFEKDYQTPSPYNTYLNPGLPPGPVNSPGRSSIQAALYPADIPYLYFVARPDGRHQFSSNYQEHLRAIREVRRPGTASEAVRGTGPE